MARRFMVGSLPFDYVLDHILDTDEFVADAKLVGSLPEESFAALKRVLASSSGFLDQSELASIASQHVADPVNAKDLARIIIRLHGLLADSGRPSDEAKRIFRDALIKKMTKLPSVSEREAVADRLTALATETPGLDLQYKATKLAEERGQHLESVDFVTDMRPVFNDARTDIKGGFPITILNMSISDPYTGEETSFRVEVGEATLAELLVKAQRAVQKVASIRAFMAKNEIPVPRVSVINNS